MRKDIPQPPCAKACPDMNSNPAGVDEKVTLQQELEKHLVPLRITPTLLLLVPPQKATPEYAEWFRENRMYQSPQKR